MSLGAAKIDIVANLAPLRVGIASARAGITKLVSDAKSKMSKIKIGISGSQKQQKAIKDMQKRMLDLGFSAEVTAKHIEDKFGAAFSKTGRSLRKVVPVIVRNLKKIGIAARKASLAILKMGPSAMRAAAMIKRGMGSAFRLLRSGMQRVISISKRTALAILGIGIASVKLATDAIETENLFSVTFDKMADSVRDWANTYSKSLGLFIPETKKAVGTFQLMLTSMGIASDKALVMSKRLTTLVNDVASFRNVRPGEIFTKIAAGITGETEGLKRIGILINDTIIKQMALGDASFLASREIKNTRFEYKRYGNTLIKVSKTTKKAGLELTQLEKIMFRYKALLNATDRDQGDMARTLNDSANVFRVLWGQIKTTGITIGNVLLPAVTKVAIVMRDWLIENQATVEKWATKVRDGVLLVGNEIVKLFNIAKSGDFEALGARLSDTLTKVAGVVRKLLGKFAPVAFDIGKKMGDGFWSSFKDTRLGKFIGETGARLRAPATLARGIGGQIGTSINRRRVESRIGTIQDRATGRRVFEDRESISIVAELKKLNAMVGRETQGAF